MSQKNDMPNQENMSELLEELRRSYGAGSSDTMPEPSEPAVDMTEEELKARLRMQFMSDGAEHVSAEQEESYYIDEDFLAEAELEQPEENEEPREVEPDDEIGVVDLGDLLNEESPAEENDIDEEITFDQLEESEEDDGIVLTQLDIKAEEDDDVTFDQLEESEEDDGIVLTQLDIEAEEDDDDVTFDQLEESEEDDGIVLTQLDIETEEEDDDVTFDQLEETETDGIPSTKIELAEEIAPQEDIVIQPEEITEADEGISYMHLDRELLGAEAVEELVAEAEEYSEPVVAEGEEWAGPKVPVTLFPEQKFEEYVPEAEAVEEDIREGSLAEDSIATEDTSVQEENGSVINELESSEISLLMQFGCEDEILDRYSKESICKMSEEDALKDAVGESEEKQKAKNAREKIFSKYESYGRARGALLMKLGISSLFAFLLLLYEGLPAIGVELPGIMNRDDYFVSYVLLGLQAAVLCCLSVYKQIWEGAKKVFSRRPNTYSVVSVLAVITVIYDISVFFVEDAVPPTFHFAFVCVILLAVLLEHQTLTAEKRSFEFYFLDILFDSEDGSASKKKFTLCRSEGKRSTAEKMYTGGLDASQSIYFPIEIDSVAGFFSASRKTSKKYNIPAIMMIPVMAFSLLVGILALVLSGQVWMGLGAVAISLLMSMPIVWTVALWLPIERLSAGAQNDGFAFAGEGCIEHYSDCNMAIFSDLHLFAKCSPSNVNLVFYDATPRDVLLGCLNAVYTEIGGPLSETFKGAANEKLGKCRMTRIAKSGIEAVVGSNYSVLVGNEAFMLRYGINFPKITLKNQEDEIFTLCVSINGRASARIAVRYATNEMFEMFVHRLAEDGIYCAIETFDPMISTEMVSRIRAGEDTPLSIVHLGVEDHTAKQDKERDKLLFNASGEELGVLARGSRFNLAVALSASKRMKKLRKYTDMFCIGISCFGALITVAASVFGWIEGFSEFFIILYWLLSAGGLVALILKLLPPKNRFSIEQYRYERQTEKEINEMENNEK